MIKTTRTSLLQTLFMGVGALGLLFGFIAPVYAEAGIFESYIVLNGAYYDVNASTVLPDFNGQNLGSFVSGAIPFDLNGGEIKTYKNGSSGTNNATDVLSARMNYRVYPTGSASGGFTAVNLPFVEDLSNPGDQKWGTAVSDINLLNSLAPGNYTIEIYYDATTDDVTIYDSNGGGNYSATFTVVDAGMAIDGSGDLIVSGSINNDSLTISSDGTDFTISIDSGDFYVDGIAGSTGDGTGTVTIPIASVTGSQVIINGGRGDDLLTIDIDDNSNPFTKEIVFNGGAQTTQDTLAITGSATVATATLGFVNANDGTIGLTGNSLITYTGLEPVTFGIGLIDVFFNYSTSAETITVSNPAAGQTRVDSTLGEQMTFPHPSGTLTINGGDTGDDVIIISALEASYPANFVIDGEGGTDEININGSVDFVAGQNITFTAETISQSAPLRLPSGTATFDAGSTGSIVLTTATNDLFTLDIVDADTADIINSDSLGLGSLTAQTSIFLEVLSGAIGDASSGSEAANITAPSVALRATTRIGNANADDNDLDIAADTLAATTQTGDISITDDGDLNVATVDGLDGISITVGGADDEILLRDGTSGGTEVIDIDSPISNAGSGDITIYADGTAVSDELVIATDITTNGGDVLLVAMGTVNFNFAPVVSTTAGTISIHGGASYSFGGVVDLVGGVDDARVTGGGDYSLQTTEGDIFLTAHDLINLEEINTDSDNSGGIGDLRVIADIDGGGVGEIFDTMGGETTFIIADTAVFSSADGIGDGDGLEVSINTLVAENTGGGSSAGITISNDSPTLQIGSGAGLVGVNNSGGYIDLTTTGDLRISSPITAVTDVSLVSGRDIIDVNDTGTEVTGSTITLSGNLSPGGSGVGVFTTNGATSFAPNSSFEVDLTGTPSGGSHDQLNITGDFSIASNVTLSLDLSSYMTGTGSITIVDESGTYGGGEFVGFADGDQTNNGSSPNFIIEYGSFVLIAASPSAVQMLSAGVLPQSSSLSWIVATMLLLTAGTWMFWRRFQTHG